MLFVLQADIRAKNIQPTSYPKTEALRETYQNTGKTEIVDGKEVCSVPCVLCGILSNVLTLLDSMYGICFTKFILHECTEVHGLPVKE